MPRGRRSSSTRPSEAWVPNGEIVIRPLLVLAASGGGLALVLFMMSFSRIKSALLSSTASITAMILRGLGIPAQAFGFAVISDSYKALIILECTGIFPGVIFIAAVLCHPATWKNRCRGILVGLMAIMGLNQLRLVSLFLLGGWFPDTVDSIHLGVWQPLMILSTLLLFVAWAVRHGRPSRTR